MSNDEETPANGSKFKFPEFDPNTFLHERRLGIDRRANDPVPVAEGRRRKDRRRKVDPTTFEKQYLADEIEFMNAMQAFKTRSGKAFPSYSEVLSVAQSLGYQRQTNPADPLVKLSSGVDSGEISPVTT